MNLTRFQSLKTSNLAGGVALSTELAREIAQNLASTRLSIPKPGGMNYGEPVPIPQELIAGILLVAVSLANDGWARPEKNANPLSS